MPFCAHCGWGYEGSPQFCRQCGRPIYRSPARGALQVLPGEQPPTGAGPLGSRSAAALFALGLAAGSAYLLTGLAGATTAASSFPLDEAWVRLVYARNLAQTGALEFNAGLPDAGVGSLLWVGLLAVLIKTLGALGISVIALAKGASLLAGAAAAPLAAELTRRLTLSRMAGLAAGTLVALDPTFAFAGAGGVEATLLAATALGALVAYVAGQPAVCGALLALAILTRPEAAGLAVLLGLAATGPLARDWRERWRAGGWAGAVADWRDWRRAVGPLVALGAPSLAALLWLSQHGGSTAALLPRVPDLAVPHLPSPLVLWRGYLEPWAGLLGGAFPIGLLIAAVGALALARSRGLFGLSIGLTPPLLALGAAAVAPPESGPWSFALRHRVDPALPVLAVLLVVGLGAIWRAGRDWAGRRPVGTRARAGRALAVAAVALLATAAPVAASLGLWATGPAEYLGRAAWLADTYVAAGRLARDSVPEEVLIAALEPGAVRYVSRRPVADLTGQHTPTIEARGAVAALLEARAQYAALPMRPAFESVPSASLLRRLGEGDDAVGLFRLTLGAPTGPRESPYAFPTEALRRLDYLDVGNEAGERAHGYVPTGLVGSVRLSSWIRPDAAVDDDGRRVAEGESFDLQAEPGRDLILARRYEATTPTPLRLTVDGQPAGEWTPRRGRYVLAEETLRVPGGLVRRGRVTVAVQAVAGRATSFAYWAFADR